MTLLSDYGLGDAFVGVCHGVIVGICPQARIIDVAHGIVRHDVETGALVLAQAIAFLPVGVHVAVVDPGVGGDRRAVALALADGRILVGPDNGLLWPAAQACGGVRDAVEISSSPLRLEPVSATFHGRDLFAPVAAHLACGVPLCDVGEPLGPSAGLVTLERPRARIERGALVAQVAYVDGYGNVTLAVGDELLDLLGPPCGEPLFLTLPSGATVSARHVLAFTSAPSGELVVYEDSSRSLAIAVNQGSASRQLALGIGDVVRLQTAS